MPNPYILLLLTHGRQSFQGIEDMMGSPIVMIFEKDYVDLQVEAGQKVRFTDRVAKVVG